MTLVTRKVIVDAPKAAVWKAISDLGNVYKTNPAIAASELTSSQEQGVGATRKCDMTMMNATLFERIVGWEEGERIEIDIYDWKNMPGVKAMGAVFTIEEVSSTQTLVQATMDYDLKWGAIGAAIDGAMMRKQNIKGWEKFLAGIKHHVETGEVVSKKTSLDTDLVTAAT